MGGGSHAKGTGKKAWRLITLAKVAVNKTRRKVLMQEAFDLLTRASALRRLDLDSDEVNGDREQGYRMRLSDGDDTTLWVYLQAESRADAMWAAYALGHACSDYFDDFDLWDGANHLLSANTKFSSFFLLRRGRRSCRGESAMSSGCGRDAPA
jgi:hypothetical protein